MNHLMKRLQSVTRSDIYILFRSIAFEMLNFIFQNSANAVIPLNASEMKLKCA